MARDLTNLEVLSTREGFNAAVRHINKTLSIMDSIASRANLGDLLYELEDETLSGERVGLLLRMLLVDKLGYKALSSNLSEVVSDPASLAGEFARWNAVDIVAAYHHPDMGLLIANPKAAEEIAGFGMLRKRELLVIYAGKAGKPADEVCEKAAASAIALFDGLKVKVPAELYKGEFTAKKPKKVAAPRKSKKAARAAPAARRVKAGVPLSAAARRSGPAVPVSADVPAAKSPVRMTPMYSVVVQNELFHNGNVEAWKRIIESYNAKYPELEVHIYYERERILDINSLFKWGKVKHGSSIQFAVAGNDIKDVAKLQRYLIQGASHQFEAFLRGPVNTVLKLF
ncbi:hypothetical protein FACS189468_1440 [Spirochaetia bacterium]|nr:hypothetical protein FACS189468_1440 [Spirochaetia bacterium]